LWHKPPGWYEVHELLRQYGRERLADAEQVEREVCDRHSRYYLEQLARLAGELKNANQVATLASIDLEHENYRAAWNWAAVQGNTTLLNSALEALCLYYDLSLRFPEGQSACRWASEGLPVDRASTAECLLRVRLLTWQSRFTRVLGQPEEASQLLDQALVQLKNEKAIRNLARSVKAFLTYEIGNNYFHNDRAAATACYQQSLKIYRQQQDAWGTAKTLARLGLVAHHAGSFSDAVQRYSDCLEIYRKLDDPRGVANTLIELGHNSLRQGQYYKGQGYIREGTTILHQIRDRAGVARGYFELGRSYFWSSQFAQSIHLMSQSVPIFEDLGMRDRLVFTAIALSLGFSHLGQYQEAISQVNKSLPLAIEMEASREVAMAYLLLGKACLGLGEYEQALKYLQKSVTDYQEIDQKDEQYWALALTFFAKRGLNQTPISIEEIKQVLQTAIDIQGYYPVLCTICGIALTLLDISEIERAVELAELV